MTTLQKETVREVPIEKLSIEQLNMILEKQYQDLEDMNLVIN